MPAQVLVPKDMLLPADGTSCLEKGDHGEAIWYSFASHGHCLRELGRRVENVMAVLCLLGSMPKHM